VKVSRAILPQDLEQQAKKEGMHLLQQASSAEDVLMLHVILA